MAKANVAYKFKPNLNMNHLNTMFMGFVAVILVVFGKNIINFMNSMFAPAGGTNVKTETGKELSDAIKKQPVPVVDPVRMSEKLNHIIFELGGLFGVSGKKIISILSDCSASEKEWIYIQFGVRVYQHGLLSRKEELGLFGWFDRGLSKSEIKDMIPVWQNTRYKYVPVYGERNWL